ncbi:MAG: PIN domain-containing protein [Opitutales bacterium]|nr:PIN domain-containing protein [Opitutales bacterium]
MSGSTFVDTNILLYARDASEPDKQPVAESILAELWESRGGRVSIQVLNEYFVNATQKLDPGMSADDAWEDIESLMVWEPVPLDTALISRTFATHSRYGLSWWDSMIVAAAERGGCSTILSEDLSDGQRYFGITVVNPFVGTGPKRGA